MPLSQHIFFPCKIKKKKRYAPDAIIGKLGQPGAAGGGGGGGGAAAPLPALPAGQAYYSKEEVAKHTTKEDCWVRSYYSK
jgi:hypothetical protein